MAVSAVGVRPEVAKAELARRELARRHLVDFMEYVSPWYHAARHHRIIADYLELVETYIRSGGQTGIGRLLISVPPRHGKTEMVSRHFPAWVLGRLPNTHIILASYGASLATDNSRAARGIVMGERYRGVFGDRGTMVAPFVRPTGDLSGFAPEEHRGSAVQLSSDSRSVEDWDLAAPYRGGLVATGVGGGITGKGAHLMVIDDPFKNRKEAESESYRRDVWEWWTSTARTRMEDGGAVIGMFTRWHADDWAGRLLRNMVSNPKAEKWTAVTMMALWEPPVLPDGAGQELVARTFEEYQREQQLNGAWIEETDPLGRKAGEALWPEKYNEKDLELIRDAIGPYDWEALYQQRPYSRTGNLFRREWFVVVDDLTPGPFPEGKGGIIERVRYWDIATTAGGGAFTAGVLLAKGSNGIIYVEHVARGQWSEHERDETIIRIGKADMERIGARTVIWHEQEPGSSGKDAASARNIKLAEAGLEAHFATVTGDKVVRAGPWSSALEAGKVRLVRGGWNEGYIDRHVAFPMGRLKDDIDASDGAFAKLGQAVIEGQVFY